MWQSAVIQLTAGAGNADINLTPRGDPNFVGILTQIYIPSQAGVNSGTTDFTISHRLPDSLLSTIFTLTNPTTPFRVAPQALVYDQAGAVTTSYGYQFVQTVNIAVTSGVGAERVTVWLLIG